MGSLDLPVIAGWDSTSLALYHSVGLALQSLENKSLIKNDDSELIGNSKSFVKVSSFINSLTV